MKKSIVFLAFFAVALMATAVRADQVQLTGLGYYQNTAVDPYGPVSSRNVAAGELNYEFQIPPSPSFPLEGLTSFSSFCIELNEQVNQQGVYDYEVNSDWEAVNGGQNTDDNDPISEGTAKLFYDYATNANPITSNSAAVNLQKAIWWLEDEIELTEQEQSDNTFLAALAGDTTYANLATWKSTNYDPFGNAPGVWVLNLYQNDGLRQDTLVLGSEATPEPATMGIWALGMAGFAGFGAYRRRKNRKA